MSSDPNYILSGRNTIIHKQKKTDLLILNGEADPVVKVTNRGVVKYEGEIPKTKAEAKKAYMEVVSLSAAEVFGELKTLLFIQAMDNREYKVDYTKIGTSNFLKVHQDSYL